MNKEQALLVEIDAAQVRTDGDYSAARKIGEAFENISRAEEFIQLAECL
ncbi:MAG: hypothetical protein WBD47_08270 [Phormidesmis sp.]